jgi:hypothetical protein
MPSFHLANEIAVELYGLFTALAHYQKLLFRALTPDEFRSF